MYDSNRIKKPAILFLAISLNLLLAPVVQAATSETITRWQAYTVGILLISTIALAVYLFTVIFQPERF